MPYWEYEYFIKYANELIEEENKRQEEGSEGYDEASMRRRTDSMMRDSQKSIPKMTIPKMPSFSIPKI